MILKLVPRRPKGSGGARCQLGLAGMGGLPTPRVFLPGFPDLLSLAGGGEMGAGQPRLGARACTWPRRVSQLCR